MTYKKRTLGTRRRTGIKRRLWRAQKYKCAYCGCAIPAMDKDVTRPDGVLEHVIPISKGGSNNGSNLVLACQGCDKEKGNAVWSVTIGNSLLNQELIVT